MQNRSIVRTTSYIAKVAVMAALFVALKFALSFIPNVEIVTLLIMVFSSAFGMIYTLPATLVFSSIEVLIYGVHSWVILYFVYWPLLAIISSILLKRKNVIIAIIVALIMSILFGVLSACSDTILCIGSLSSMQLRDYFIAYYLRGLYFDLIHVVSNVIIVGILYLPLIEVCKKIDKKAFNSRVVSSRHIINCDYEYNREDVSNNWHYFALSIQ